MPSMMEQQKAAKVNGAVKHSDQVSQRDEALTCSIDKHPSCMHEEELYMLEQENKF